MKPSERPPEKSHYSYQEMMAQLRRQRRRSPSGSKEPATEEPSSSAGSHSSRSERVRVEVVEGEDGRQRVAEVRRRRKRRSHQPKKVRERRLKLIKRGLFLVGVPLVVGVIGAYFLMLSAIKGQRFQKEASSRFSEMSGKQMEFGTFKLRGLVLSSRKLKIENPSRSGSNLFQNAEVHSLKSDVKASTFLSGDWNLKTLLATDGEFRFGWPLELEDEDTLLGAKWAIPRMLMGGIGLDRKPGTVNLAGIRIASSDFYWDDEEGESVLFLTKTGVNTGPVPPVESNVHLSFQGGELAIPGWPSFGVQRISGIAEGGSLKIIRSKLEHIEGGVAELTGGIGVRGKGSYDLTVDFEDMMARHTVHPYWRERLDGSLSGTVGISGSLKDMGESGLTGGVMEANGNFTGRNFVVGRDRILKEISRALGEALLEQIEFRTFSGKFTRNSTAGWVFSDLEGVAPSLLTLKGRVAVSNEGALDGTLSIGIQEGILSKIPGALQVFSREEEDGFFSTDVQIYGLIDEPREDLSTRLAAIGQSVPGGGAVPDGGAPGLQDSFEKLIAPPAPAE